jgi:hypothetical protein
MTAPAVRLGAVVADPGQKIAPHSVESWNVGMVSSGFFRFTLSFFRGFFRGFKQWQGTLESQAYLVQAFFLEVVHTFVALGGEVDQVLIIIHGCVCVIG